MVKRFVNRQQENGSCRKEAMQTGAEAFHIWKSMDASRNIKSLLDINLLSSWIDQAVTSHNKGSIMVSKYLSSLERLIDCLVEEGDIKEKDVHRSRQVQNHIQFAKQLRNIGTANDCKERQNMEEPENGPECETKCSNLEEDSNN